MSNPGEMMAAWLASNGVTDNGGRSQTSPATEGDPTVADVSELGRDAILAMFFDTGKWRDLDNHVCTICEAGFLDPERAVDHVLSGHPGLVDLGRATVETDEGIADGEPATVEDLEMDWPDDEGIEL